MNHKKLLRALLGGMVMAAAATAFAGQPAPPPASKAQAQPRPAADPAQVSPVSIAPAAADAVLVVDSFMGALVQGQFDGARRFMTPDAVVLTDGYVIGNRDAYLDGLAKKDAAWLKESQRQLLRREAKGGPGISWVISEKLLRENANAQGKASALVLTESMVLVKTLEGWKIAHVHWSSRAVPRN